MSTVTKDHLGKRILVKAADLTHPEILEARVLELSTNGTLAKLLIRNGMTWTKMDSFEVLDVLPDMSVIEEINAALHLAKQENAILVKEKEEVAKSITELNRTLAETAGSVEALSKQVQTLSDANGTLKEEKSELSKKLFGASEANRQLAAQVTDLMQKLAAAKNPPAAPVVETPAEEKK